MSLLKADTLKPVTSSGDLSLQGDSGGSAVDCLNITSAGDINFTGNTNAKIKLPSAGGIYESDGSTAILTESGGAVTLDNVTLGSSVTGGGAVSQVLQTVKTDKASFSASGAKNTYTLIPGQGGSGVFQQAITITGSNKVLINAHVRIAAGSAGYTLWWAFLRGTAVDTAMASCTRVAVGTDPTTNQNNATDYGRTENNSTLVSSAMTWLDNPGAGTYYYKIGVDIQSGSTGYFNRTGADGDNIYNASVASSITLMEVSA